MKKFFFYLIAILALSSQSFAQSQDTVWMYNVNSGDTVFSPYSFNEVDSLIMTSRTAFLDDAELLLYYEFKVQKLKKPFWYDAINRYINWPKEAELYDLMGKYYHPKSMIFVPNNDYVNAIVFDWSTKDLKIAIFCIDGLWQMEPGESLDEKWNIFIDSTFIKTIDFSDDEQEGYKNSHWISMGVFIGKK